MDFGISPSGFRKDFSRAQERLTHRLQCQTGVGTCGLIYCCNLWGLVNNQIVQINPSSVFPPYNKVSVKFVFT